MNGDFWNLLSFHRPSIICLVLLAFVPLIWWRWLRRSRHSAIRFSSLDNLRRQGASLAVRLRHVIPMLRTLAVVLLIVSLARPRKGDEETRIISEGIAIQLLVDRSSSMLAEDFVIDGERANRLATVKAVATEFVIGDEDSGLGGRDDDLIGMITFAGYADSKCPLTLDHAYLVDTLSKVQIASQKQGRDEDGTAIGDAIALGVERMRDLVRRRNVLEANRVKSKILVLLTDGEQTRGDLSPQQGAEIAKAFDVKIYTIGVGTRGMAPMPAQDFFGRMILRSMPVTIDEATLKQVAKITGGQYFRATDTDSLRRIYVTIDELEKTKTEEKRYLQHVEMATQSVGAGWFSFPPPLLLLVAGLLVLEVLLGNTRLRKIP